SFNDAEAFALMASAYRMTAEQFDGPKKTINGFPAPKTVEKWRFLAVEKAMKAGSAAEIEKGREHLEKLLNGSGSMSFKIWTLSSILRAISYLGAALSIIGIGLLLYEARDVPLDPSIIYMKAEPFLPELIKQNVPDLTFGLVGKTILSFLLFSA